MKSKLLAWLLCLSLAVAAVWAQTAPSSAAPAGPRVRLGVAPVYDGNSQDFSANFVQHLTFMFYKSLLNRPDVEPVLLNPGGVYDPAPGGDEWTLNYAHKMGVDVVLVTSLLTNAKTDHRTLTGQPMTTLRVSVALLDVDSGRRTPLKVLARDVSFLDLGGYTGTSVSFWSGEHKSFEKQKKGKVAAHFVDDAIEYIDQHLPTLAAQRSGSISAVANPAPASCPFSFSVRYMPRNVNSMSYSLIVNGLELSSEIKDGVVRVVAPVGPIVVQSDMQDAPHRMTPQKYYQANAIFDCSASQKNLVLELNVAGDAQLLWEP